MFDNFEWRKMTIFSVIFSNLFLTKKHDTIEDIPQDKNLVIRRDCHSGYKKKFTSKIFIENGNVCLYENPQNKCIYFSVS